MATIGLGSGAALLLHATVDVSLALGLAVLLAGGAALFTYVYRRLDAGLQRAMLERIRVGALAGLIGALAYDAARLGFVTALGLDFKPFAAWPLFGQGLLGTDISTTAAYAAGACFHFANGTLFGVAYALFVRRPAWWSGILWALCLEALMLSLYPSWLDIKSLGEFTQVSVLGHVVYGSVLGTLTKRWATPL